MDVLAVRDVRGAGGRAGAARQGPRADRGADLPVPRPLHARSRGSGVPHARGGRAGAAARSHRAVQRAVRARRCPDRGRPRRHREGDQRHAWTKRWRSRKPPRSRPRSGCSPTCTRTERHGGHDVSGGAEPGPPRGDAPRPPGLRDRRGGRALRRRLQGDAGTAQGVRGAAHRRHADRGVGLHRASASAPRCSGSGPSSR